MLKTCWHSLAEGAQDVTFDLCSREHLLPFNDQQSSTPTRDPALASLAPVGIATRATPPNVFKSELSKNNHSFEFLHHTAAQAKLPLPRPICASIARVGSSEANVVKSELSENNHSFELLHHTAKRLLPLSKSSGLTQGVMMWNQFFF